MIDKIEIHNTCISCNSCAEVCPENAVTTNGKTYVIDQWSCTRCTLCIHLCPTDSIKWKYEAEDL